MPYPVIAYFWIGSIVATSIVWNFFICEENKRAAFVSCLWVAPFTLVLWPVVLFALICVGLNKWAKGGEA